jgi:hypothetical protein
VIDNDVSEHARALSALGAAKGGKARAEAMTPERRTEVARLAAQKRWGADAKLRGDVDDIKRALKRLAAAEGRIARRNARSEFKRTIARLCKRVEESYPAIRLPQRNRRGPFSFREREAEMERRGWMRVHDQISAEVAALVPFRSLQASPAEGNRLIHFVPLWVHVALQNRVGTSWLEFSRWLKSLSKSRHAQKALVAAGMLKDDT